MQTLTREIFYVVRQLEKQSGLVFIVVLTLALSIGASTLIFSVVEGVLLRPLPFRDPERLVVVKENVNLLKEQGVDLPAPDVLHFANESRTFKQAGGFEGAHVEL